MAYYQSRYQPEHLKVSKLHTSSLKYQTIQYNKHCLNICTDLLVERRIVSIYETNAILNYTVCAKKGIHMGCALVKDRTCISLDSL